MMYAAEEAARFLHHACRGLPLRVNGHTTEPLAAEDSFYARALENALGYLGSRVMYPARPALRETDLYELYEQTHEDLEQQSAFGFEEFVKLVDFMVLHRQFELNPQRFSEVPKPIEEGVVVAGEKLEYVTRQLGYLLGSELYNGYLEGRVTRGCLRRLFLTHLGQPGAAREEIIGRALEMISNTAPFDISHHPAMAVPCGMSEGLPISMMLVGKHFDEPTIYRAAYAFEQGGDWREM